MVVFVHKFKKHVILVERNGSQTFLGSDLAAVHEQCFQDLGNTNQVVHGGSAIMWSEFSVKYLLDALRQILSSGAKAMDVKDETYWSHSQRMDEASLLRAWGFSKVSSWYKNSKGRATQNYPFSSAELWRRTHEISLADFELTGND